MIPKKLHQTAKTSSLPEKWKAVQEKAIALHPNWTYTLWTDNDNEAFVEDSYPDLYPIYNELPKPIMKADVARYLHLHAFGGLYLDTDYEFLKPFDLLDYSIVLPRESEDSQPVFLGNCVMASEPNHPFWIAVIDDLIQNPPSRNYNETEGSIIDLTGPGFLTRIYRDQFSTDSSIYIPSKDWFHPPTPRTLPEYTELAKDPKVYGIHFCFGSWRKLTLKEQVLRKLNRLWKV